MKRISIASIFLVMFFAAAHGQAPVWTDYSSKEQQFTVSFPGRPSVSKAFVDEKQGTKYTFMVGDDDRAYILLVCDGPGYAGPFTAADLKGRYDAAQKASVEQMPGSRVISQNDLKTGGAPAREFIGENDQWYYRCRYILARGRIYGIMALVSKSLESDATVKASMTKFLDSFHFN